MAELEGKQETKTITSEVMETTNLSSNVYVTNVDGTKKQLLTMSISLTQGGFANVSTYVTDRDLFLANSKEASLEVAKFRELASKKGLELNCFVL